MGLIDSIRGFFEWLNKLLGGSGIKEGEKVLPRYISKDYWTRDADEAAEDDFSKIKDPAKKKIIKAIAELLLNSKKIFNAHEAVIKTNAKLLFHKLYNNAYSTYLKSDSIANLKAFNDLYQELMKEILELDKDKLKSYFDEFSKTKNEALSVIESIKEEGNKKKYKKKLEDSMSYSYKSLLKDLKVLIEFKKYFYEQMIKQIDIVIKKSKTIEKSKSLKNLLKKIKKDKEEAFSALKDQVKIVKSMEKKKFPKMKQFDEMFSKLLDEVNADASAVQTECLVLAIFMSKPDFIGPLKKSHEYLREPERDWFRNQYAPYVLEMLKSLTQRKKKLIEKVKDEVEKAIKKTEQQPIALPQYSKEEIEKIKQEIKESAEKTKEQEQKAEEAIKNAKKTPGNGFFDSKTRKQTIEVEIE